MHYRDDFRTLLALTETKRFRAAAVIPEIVPPDEAPAVGGVRKVASRHRTRLDKKEVMIQTRIGRRWPRARAGIREQEEMTVPFDKRGAA